MTTRIKKFRLRPEQIIPLVTGMGGCIASDRITVDGAAVGTMAREAPESDHDSGWVFLAGDESQSFLDDPANLDIYDVNTIANYDPEIIPFLYALPGQRFDRRPEGNGFVEAEDSNACVSAEGWPDGVEVEQGQVQIAEEWSMTLPTPFRRRREPGALRFWRPRLTLWVGVRRDQERTRGEILERVHADASPAAFDLRRTDDGRLARFSYRLREDTADAKVASLYENLISSRGHLRFSIYADSEQEIGAARSIVDSVTSTWEQ